MKFQYQIKMLTHYVIVRRDLPLGTLAAMILHAAGESASYRPDIHHCIAVVLEVKNELGLHLLAYDLDGTVDYVKVFENSGPYNGQFMAIGVMPCERERVSHILADYQTLKKLDNPSEPV